MALGKQAAADRVERFLDAHPDGRLVVCVGSASVAGIVWLAERSRRRPVTLLIGDLKSRNFAKATDADRRAALDFVERSDVSVRNWYRTQRSGQGRSEAHLKVWAACDARDTPQAFLVGSANLTLAGLHDNVELMALADATEHPTCARQSTNYRTNPGTPRNGSPSGSRATTPPTVATTRGTADPNAHPPQAAGRPQQRPPDADPAHSLQRQASRPQQPLRSCSSNAARPAAEPSRRRGLPETWRLGAAPRSPCRAPGR